MGIRFLCIRASCLLLFLMLLASGASAADYYWRTNHSAVPGDFPSATSACQAVFSHFGWTLAGIQARPGGTSFDCMHVWDSPGAVANRYGSSCPAGTEYNSALGQCDPVASEPCEWPKTGEPGNCSCPPPGTTLDKPVSYNPNSNPGGTPRYCAPVNINGCGFESCDSRNVDAPIKDGKPCVVKPDGETTCYSNLTSNGQSYDDCGDDCGNPGTPVDSPTPVEPPSTSEQTEVDPTTGATTEKASTTEKVVNPDGSTTETTVQTEIKTENGETTTTTTTTTKNQSSNGTTTTTTKTDVTDGQGNTTTTVSGTSTTQDGEGTEGDGSGTCDPTKANYLECVGMLDEVGDGDAQTMLDGIAQAGDTAITEQADAFSNALAEGNDVAEPSALRNLVDAVLPSSVSCSDLSMSFKGHTMNISCTKMAPLRQWLGWFFAVLTIITIYYIALRPQGSN